MDVLLLIVQALLISVLAFFGLTAVAFFVLLMVAGIPLGANRRRMEAVAPGIRCIHCGALLSIQALELASNRAAALAIKHRKFWFTSFRMRPVDAICSCGTEYRFDPANGTFIACDDAPAHPRPTHP